MTADSPLAGAVYVDDVDDPRVSQFRLRDRQLFPGEQGRRQDALGGLFVAEGDLVVARALAAGFVPFATLADQSADPAVLARLAAGPTYLATAPLRAELTGLGVPSAVISLFHRSPAASAAEVLCRARRVVMAEEVDNPTNLGTIIRSAAGLGWDTVLVDATSADPFARRCVRTSMGTVFSVATARLSVGRPLDVLHEAGFLTVALTPRESAEDVRRLERLRDTERLALVLGAERSGLSDDTIAGATVAARIAMHHGTDSLNVAAAAAVACYALGT